MLDPLSSALLNVMTTPGETASQMKTKIIQILLIFCQVSHGDGHVRNALGTRKIVRRRFNSEVCKHAVLTTLVSSGLLRACELLDPEHLVVMLKAVKHLSMNPTLLDVLQNANAIEILTRILDEQRSGAHSAVS